MSHVVAKRPHKVLLPFIMAAALTGTTLYTNVAIAQTAGLELSTDTALTAGKHCTELQGDCMRA